MTSAQWFVKMAPLAKPAMDVVNEGKTKFVPDRFSKTYLRWMENVHDWCIPVSCGGVTASRRSTATTAAK